MGEQRYLALVGTLCSTSQPVWSEGDILLLSYGKGEFAPWSSWVSHTGYEYSQVLASYGEPDPCRDILYNQSYHLLGKTDCRNISFVGCNRDRVVKWELVLSVFSMGKGSCLRCTPSSFRALACVLLQDDLLVYNRPNKDTECCGLNWTFGHMGLIPLLWVNTGHLLQLYIYKLYILLWTIVTQ